MSDYQAITFRNRGLSILGGAYMLAYSDDSHDFIPKVSFPPDRTLLDMCGVTTGPQL